MTKRSTRHVNVAERIELLATVSAKRDQRERAFCVRAFLLGDRGGGRKHMLQQHIDKIDSPNKQIHVTLSRDEIKGSPSVETANIELIETLPPPII